MHIPRIYIPQPLSEHISIELDKASMHHLVTVMRMKVGRELILFNGQPVEHQENKEYGEFTATLAHIDKKHARIDIGFFSAPEVESPLKIHLGMCLIKNDRMDWLLQKATELGVSSITPLFSQYTDVKMPADRTEKKMAHWHKILINACEQSGRVRVPDLHAPIPLNSWVQSRPAMSKKFVLHPYVTPNAVPSTISSTISSTTEEAQPSSSVALLVGPEGGLTEQEVDLAVDNQFLGMKLGPRILRAETAPLAALAVLLHQFGDL
jgi:16S rRNA (uracil1498-N3)-methyltransferase